MQTADRSSKKVFFISRIGDEGTSIRFTSDLVLSSIVGPAALALGFAGAERADEMNQPGRITDQVIHQIVDGPAVVADLSGHNPNVFYEIALAHAARTPLVQIVDRSDRNTIPFDITDQRTISYDLTRFSSYAEASDRVEQQLRSALANPDLVDNPVVTFAKFRWLAEPGTPPASNTDMVVPLLLDLRDRMTSIERSRPFTPPSESDIPAAPPHQFYGSADLNGHRIPDGTRIYAWGDSGRVVGDALLVDGTWLIQVDPAHASTVSFSVDDSLFTQAQAVTPGSLTPISLDLKSL